MFDLFNKGEYTVVMKEKIIEYIVANKFRLFSETREFARDRLSLLAKENPDFHSLIEEQYQKKILGHVIRDLSLNLGVDYETSMVELEGVDLEKVLA